MIKVLTDETIDDVLNSSRTFIIVFYASILPNVSHIMELFERFDKQFKGKIDVYKVDYETESKIARYFNMKLLPGMVIMKNRTTYGSISGPISTVQYEGVIKNGIIDIIKDSNN